MPVDPATVAALGRLGSATVYEAASREGLVDLSFQTIVPGAGIAGPARTVSCGQGDNLMVHAAVPQLREGEVLVVAMPESQPVALVGDLLVTQLLTRGAAGLVLNGSVRDVAALRELGLPIWTPYVRVRGARRQVVGTVGEPIRLGGAEIATGDVIVADADGVVVVAAGRSEEIRSAAEDREQRERDKRAQFQAGVTSFDLYGLADEWPQLFGTEGRVRP